MITIAIDAMGGDHGPSVTIPAAVNALKKYTNLKLIMVGNEVVLQSLLLMHAYDATRLLIQHASEQVEMHELPSSALRNKKDSSMRVAINLVKDGQAQACVSAGNTGALMAIAKFVLKTLPGIDRPAIISTMPTVLQDKNMRMLDLGANVDCTAENLVQFAVMGSVLASAVDNMPNPKVFLLNIGQEEIKGNEQVKQTAQLLASMRGINYCGYIEADSIYDGDADIIVCDGFVGNVALKATEGAAHLIGTLTKQAFMRNIFTKLLGAVVKPVLKPFTNRVDPARYNGATLIGLKGTVIKSHGGAKVNAFENAIHEALREVEKNIPERIQHEVAAILDSSHLSPGANNL
jgi:glycerol-3-phosphate acyltransferase PlsX